MFRLAQIARACGRVSVGGYPDKRPEKRRNKTGSRRRTGEPRLNGGSRLKATTDRAFLVSVGPPKVDNRRGLSFLPGVRTGSPFQTMATDFDGRSGDGFAAEEPWKTSRFSEAHGYPMPRLSDAMCPDGAPPDRLCRAARPAGGDLGCGSKSAGAFPSRAGAPSQPRSFWFWRGRPRPSEGRRR